MRIFNLQGTSGDAILLAIIRLLTTLLGIISTMLLSKSLSLLAYGTYSQANLIISIGTSFSILGLADGTIYFFNKKKSQQECRDSLNTVFALQVCIGILLGITIILFQNIFILYFDNTNLSQLFIYIAFRPLLNNLLAMLQNLQISIGKAKAIAVRNITVAIVKLFAIYLAINVFYSIKTIFLILLLLDAVTVLYFWLSFTMEKYPIQVMKAKKELLPEILRFCIPMGIFVLTNSLSRDIDKFCIGRLGGTKELAIYTNCSTVLPVDIISAAFLTMVIPIMTRYITRKDYKEGEKLFSYYVQQGYLTTTTFASAIIMLSVEMIEFLYGEKYIEGKIIFILYMVVSVLRFANLSLVISANGESKRLMIISIVSLIANVFMNFGFYYAIGFIGPAIATVIITLATTIILLKRSIFILKTSWNTVFNFKQLAIYMLEIFLTGFVFRQFANILNQYNFTSFSIIIFSGGGMCCVIFALNLKKILALFKQINKLK